MAIPVSDISLLTHVKPEFWGNSSAAIDLLNAGRTVNNLNSTVKLTDFAGMSRSPFNYSPTSLSWPLYDSANKTITITSNVVWSVYFVVTDLNIGIYSVSANAIISSSFYGGNGTITVLRNNPTQTANATIRITYYYNTTSSNVDINCVGSAT